MSSVSLWKNAPYDINAIKADVILKLKFNSFSQEQFSKQLMNLKLNQCSTGHSGFDYCREAWKSQQGSW